MAGLAIALYSPQASIYTVTPTSDGFVFSVNLDTVSPYQVTVACATQNGTATAGEDYIATSGTLTFAPGQTTHLVTVQVVADDADEIDETFYVNLSNAANATIGGNPAEATIFDDDPLPIASVSNVTVTEGDSGTMPVVLSVNLTPASGRSVRFDVATFPGTALQGGVDFESTCVRVLRPAGRDDP